LASYEAIRHEGNTAHKSTCPYHSSRLPSYALIAPEGFLDEHGNLLPLQDEVDEDEEDENVAPEVSRRNQRVLVPIDVAPTFICSNRMLTYMKAYKPPATTSCISCEA
jgi:hypothetical protein